MAHRGAEGRDYITVALIGQPNCGKSTIFNSIAGLSVSTGNFPGTTVSYTDSVVRYMGHKLKIVDLPGIYSFYTGDVAEEVALDYILNQHIDVVVNVVDASVLSRSLEFTLELCDLQIPMIMALNMMDEARRKGLDIDVSALSSALGIPVVPTTAHHGVGIAELFRRVIKGGKVPLIKGYADKVEAIIRRLERRLGSRSLAVMYLEGVGAVAGDKGPHPSPKAVRKALGREGAIALSEERHKMAMALFEDVGRVGHSHGPGWRERLDSVMLHPFYGFLFMALVFAGILGAAFVLGDILSSLIVEPMEIIGENYITGTDPVSIALRGLWDGVVGGAGIVVPYMIPLMFFLGLLEDIGYNARAAYVLDRIFHQMGLHGKAAGPFLLGYGCTVPAIMATRILDNPKDRLKLAFLVPMIPCSARSVVILALIGGIFGPVMAMFMYLFNIVAIGLAGGLIRAMMGTGEYGLIMEVPDLKVPSLKIIWKKTYFILYEFAVMAWPIIISGSVVLAFMSEYGIEGAINTALAPFTVYVLGLPAVLGFTLIFGIFRKELALLMTLDAFALSASHISGLLGYMTQGQVFTYVVFLTFYIPCLSTLAVMYREFGLKTTTMATAFNIGFATALALLFRALFMIPMMV